MLASCFRSIAHHAFHFRPSLQVASISTTVVRKQQQDFGDLINAIKETSEQRKSELDDREDGPRAFKRMLSGTFSMKL